MKTRHHLFALVIALAGLMILSAQRAAAGEPTFNDFRPACFQKKIDVKTPGNRAAGLTDFARAFTLAFPSEILTNALRARLDDPKNTRKDPNTLTLDPPHGYLKYNYSAEPGVWLELCFWTQPSGHRLVAVSMADTYNEEEEGLLLFYDYDPKTRSMKPFAAIRDEDFGRGVDGRIVELPRVGYDIRIYERGDRKSKPEIFKWDKGMHFDPQ